MHEKEVAGVLLLALRLRNACRHRNCRNAGRANEGVDLLSFGKKDVHQLSKQDTACRTAAERDYTHQYDGERTDVEEGCGSCCRADGDAKENGDDVAKLVLYRLGKTLGDTALAEEVTKHQRQVVDNSHALAHEVEWNELLERYVQTGLGLLVLVTNDNSEYYYDDQIIEVPQGMCMRQVGIYRYQTRMDMEKTVPIVKLMSK